MGAATTAAPYGFWATNPTKKLAHWVYLLGQPLSRNRVFQNFTDLYILKTNELSIYVTNSSSSSNRSSIYPWHTPSSFSNKSHNSDLFTGSDEDGLIIYPTMVEQYEL